MPGRDREALPAFFGFPAKPWDHLRRATPIESVVATVRTKGAPAPKTARLRALELATAAAKAWRRRKGEHLPPMLMAGVTSADGVAPAAAADQRAARPATSPSAGYGPPRPQRQPGRPAPGWHGARALVVPPNLTPVPLPPHRPEIDPIEQVRLHLRERYLSHRRLADHEAVVDACRHPWTAPAQEPERIRSLTS